MENSPYTDRTLQVLETLWQQGHRSVGTVIQSCLIRSPQDVQRLNEMGARVRLVKGAYKEPKTVAFQEKSQVDAAFVELMRELLDDGTFPAIATHDPGDDRRDQALRRASRATAKDRFEFQMLYGIRRDLQAALVAEGYGDAHLRAVRPAVVPVLHAPARRAAGERRRSCCAACSATAARRLSGMPGVRHQARVSDTSASRQASTLVDVHPLLDAVQPGAGRAEQQRRNSGLAEHRRIGPEAHPDRRRLANRELER